MPPRSPLALGVCVAATLLACSPCSAQFPDAAGIAHGVRIEDLLNHPFADTRDMADVHAKSRSLLLAARREAAVSPDPGELGMLQDLLERIAAFTDPETVTGETLFIEDFATSEDKAVRRLREEIGLPPPAGGAIVRIYPSKPDMPGPIHTLFGEFTGGITCWCRFIAIWGEDKSGAELQDTISHELTHAYVLSILGPGNDELPMWFHEGLALYLSDCRDHYISHTRFGEQRVSWSTAEYHEFRTVFRYLAATRGPQRLNAFIREAVEQRSVGPGALAILSIQDYAQLRNEAMKWRRARQWLRPQFWLVAGPVLILCFVCWVGWRIRRAREREEQDMWEALASQGGLDSDSPVADGEIAVYIAPGGSRYHIRECRLVADNATAITLSDAVDHGYAPCPLCQAVDEDE